MIKTYYRTPKSVKLEEVKDSYKIQTISFPKFIISLRSFNL